MWARVRVRQIKENRMTKWECKNEEEKFEEMDKFVFILIVKYFLFLCLYFSTPHSVAFDRHFFAVVYYILFTQFSILLALRHLFSHWNCIHAQSQSCCSTFNRQTQNIKNSKQQNMARHHVVGVYRVAKCVWLLKWCECAGLTTIFSTKISLSLSLTVEICRV